MINSIGKSPWLFTYQNSQTKYLHNRKSRQAEKKKQTKNTTKTHNWVFLYYSLIHLSWHTVFKCGTLHNSHLSKLMILQKQNLLSSIVLHLKFIHDLCIGTLYLCIGMKHYCDLMYKLNNSKLPGMRPSNTEFIRWCRQGKFDSLGFTAEETV